MKVIISLLLLTSSLFAQCDRGIVVLVHGFLQTPKDMRSMEHALNCVGLKTYNFDYRSMSGSIRDHGHCLALYTKQVADENPDQTINFVCHSLGALLLRVACNDPEFPEKAKSGRAVLSAPPSSGSEIGRKYLSMGKVYKCLGFELGYELSTYTACDIIALGAYPKTMEILIIAGCRGSRLFLNKENDGVIAVSETGIENPFYFETFYVSHYRILHYTPALNLARYFILGEYSKEECS